jgi:hypothetical protein
MDYVLCRQYPDGAQVFLCRQFLPGGDPTFDIRPEPAMRFASPQDALAWRWSLPHQLGGTEHYRVHELHPDGQLVRVEW